MKNFKIILTVITLLVALSCQNVSAQEAVESKYPIKLYGKIKLDLSYDDARVNNGNYGAWVQSRATNKDDAEMNITARETRLGANFFGPNVEDMETTGKLEFDFYEGGSENKNRLLMRHAYLKLSWPDADFSILAGQTWDVAAPVLAPTLNYTVMWWQGNPGYRRPQLRLTKGVNIDDDKKLLFQVALSRTIGDASGTGTGNQPFTPGDTGEDSATPTVQGRIALSLPLLTEAQSTIGISGLAGTEEYDLNATGTNSRDFDCSLIALDLKLPLVDKISLKGELWQGKNLDAFLAGIGQGVNMTTLKEVEADGGWLAFSFGPFGDWRFNLGAGVDDPDDADLNAGNRTKNQVVYGNVIYSINEAVQVGLEIADLETKYKGQQDADALRVQTSLIYKF